jgi:hypothetical protein
LPTDFDSQLWESLARNHRFQAWIAAERTKYTTALIRMADGEQLRVLQGRLQMLDDVAKLCEATVKT